MKKMIATIFLILILMMRLTAPATIFHPLHFMCCISDAKSVYIYNVQDSFLRAVMKFESNFNEKAVNPITKARGVLQILPVMIREVNKFSDVKYTWNDAFNPIKSIEIWYIVQCKRNPEYYYDRACRIWFGSGKQYDGMTWCEYYQIVMKNI